MYRVTSSYTKILTQIITIVRQQIPIFLVSWMINYVVQRIKNKAMA